MNRFNKRLLGSFIASLVLHALALLLLAQFWTPLRPITKAAPASKMIQVTLLPPPAPKRLKIPTPKPVIRKIPKPRVIPPKPKQRATINAPSPHPKPTTARPISAPSSSPPALASAETPTTPSPKPASQPKLIASTVPSAPLAQTETTNTDGNLTVPAFGSGAASGNGTGTASSGTKSGTGNGEGEGNGTGTGGGPFGSGVGTGEGLRHIVYVLDISLSMASRLERAKRELRAALAGLQPGESFDIVLFAGDTQVFDDRLVPSTSDNVQQASRFLDTIVLKPYTNLDYGVKKALSMQGVNVVVIITDGVPTVGEKDFKKLARLVRRENTTNARIYTIGLVGKNPDGSDDSFEATGLLQQIARDNDGEFTLATVGTADP